MSSARSLLALEKLFTEADCAFLTHFQASLKFRGPSPPSFVNTEPRFPVSAAVGPLPVSEALGTRGRCPAGPWQPRPTGMALPSGTPGTEVGTHCAAGGRARAALTVCSLRFLSCLHAVSPPWWPRGCLPGRVVAPAAFVPWRVLRADEPPASEAGAVPDVVSLLFSALGGLTVAWRLEEPSAAAAWEPERGTPSSADGRECGGGVRVAVDGFGEHTPLEGGRASGWLSGVRTCSPWHGPVPRGETRESAP